MNRFICLIAFLWCFVCAAQQEDWWRIASEGAAASAGGYNPSTDGTTIEYVEAQSFTGLSTGNTFSNWVHVVGNDLTNGAANASIYGRYISSWSDGHPIAAFTNSSGATFTYVTNVMPGQPISGPYTITCKFQFFLTNAVSYVYSGSAANNGASLECDSPPTMDLWQGGNAVATTGVPDTTTLHTWMVVFNGASTKWAVDGGSFTTASTTVNVNIIGMTLGTRAPNADVRGGVYIRAWQLQSGDQSSQWSSMYSTWYNTR